MIDNIIAENKWEFNVNVSNCFSDMIKRCIPDYDTMRNLTFNIGKKFVKEDTAIIDIGCSNGLSVLPFVSEFGDKNKYYLYDTSDSMLEKCRSRYAKEIEKGIVHTSNADISETITEKDASLIISIFTLQFVPTEKRQRALKNIYDSLQKGGALIIAEKVLGGYHDVNALLVEEYYQHKRLNGYTELQIETKEKSLSGILQPLTAKWNEELLKAVGFEKVECFWRCLNFTAWVAIK